MTDNPPVLGRASLWTTRLPVVRRGAVACTGSGVGVGVGSASKAAAGSTTGGAVTGSSGNDSGTSKGSTAVAGAPAADSAGAVGAGGSCAGGAGALWSRLGSESGKKPSVESAVALFTWGCCFFFSCEMNSTSFNRPNSTKILGWLEFLYCPSSSLKTFSP